MTKSKKKHIQNLEQDLQTALNADAIRDFNFFGEIHSIYRPYIIVSLHKTTTMQVKQKIIQYIYDTYANIHCVELVNQTSCICIDYERDEGDYD